MLADAVLGPTPFLLLPSGANYRAGVLPCSAASYTTKQAAADGGLISYGASLTDALRQGGNYVGRVPKGEKTSELPVMRSTKFELALNLKTAKAPRPRNTAKRARACRRGNRMTRRELIALLASTAPVSWPGVMSAQQTERKRRVGVLMNLAADDKEGQARLIAFVQTLSDLGWKNGSNVQIEACWGAGDTSRFLQCAAELVAVAPDVILAASASTMDPLLKRHVPYR